MDRKNITLHDLRGKVEARKRQIQSKYLRFLDPAVPMQRYAGLVGTLLMSRCDSMLLYRHLPQTSLQPRSDLENRLRDVLLKAALTTLEIGATLDTLPSLSSWNWYSTTYQQYHAVLLLLTELYRTPHLDRKERMMTIIDHIFGHCYGVGVRERCSDLLWQVKENLEAFYIMKGVNKRKATATASSQQQPQFPPMQRQSSAATATITEFSQLSLQSQLQSSMDNGLDFDSLLTGFGSGGNADGLDDFLAGVGQGGGLTSNNHGAIFMPADTGVPMQGNGWVDDVKTSSPNNGLQQWVSTPYRHNPN
jgi:hypothetical protein